MPRKKNVPATVTYQVPQKAKVNIDLFIDTSPKFKTKAVWKQKFYHLFDYIVEQVKNNDDAKKFVNVHCATMAKVLSVNNQEMAGILRDCIDLGILKCDRKAIQAEYAYEGNRKKIIKEGKSYGYLFKQDCELVDIPIPDNRRCYEKSLNWLRQRNRRAFPEMELYEEVLNCLTIDETGLEETFQNILLAKRLEKNNEKEYREYMDSIEEQYHNPNNNNIILNIAFSGAFVPEKSGEIEQKVKQKRGKYKDKKFFDSEQSTITRCKNSIRRINEGNLLADRPRGLRVYTEITRLKRELRKHLRLDGKPLIGIDIRNSQPLIASIVINDYWQTQGVIPDDVKAYQLACEKGRFYDEFIEQLGIRSEWRSQFKEDFFHRVYFSMVLKEKNLLVKLFESKYPNVLKAISDIKGGELKRTYPQFSRQLQKAETDLIFCKVNMDLIKLGVKAVNVFDSIYLTCEADYELAENMLTNAFNNIGISPTFNRESY